MELHVLLLPPPTRHLWTLPITGQLLDLVMQSERPELEAQRHSLAQQEASLRVELSALERQLLQSLATST